MNLTIPDAAVHLSVSETRLRKTLAGGDFVTRTEMRHTRTGLRKTTFLPPDTVEALRNHYLRLAAPHAEADALEAEPGDDFDSDAAAMGAQSIVCEASAPYAFASMEEAAGAGSDASVLAQGATGEGCGGAVPVEQFQALLYQHNVLREEFGRVHRYLEECDSLLEEMILTIASLEARTRGLEAGRSTARSSGNPLSGALRSVSSGLQHAFQSKHRDKDRPIVQPAEVYYAGVLSR